MVAYCSSCREDRGRHTLRGSHSSSHDSRRRYLSDAYLEKSPIFEKHRGIIPGGASWSHQEIKGEFKQGEHPQEENGPFPLMSKGES
jgi:hypothetical protein